MHMPGVTAAATSDVMEETSSRLNNMVLIVNGRILVGSAWFVDQLVALILHNPVA